MSTEDKIISGINIAPVINVALILVIVVMITSPVLNLPDIDIVLPTASVEETSADSITVTFSSDGVFGVNEEIVDYALLTGKVRELLEQRGSNTLLIIRGDKDLPFGQVEELVETLKYEAGAERVAIATIQEQ